MRSSFWRALCALTGVLWLAQPAAAQSVRLLWDPNPEPEVVGYHVYRSDAGGIFRRLTTEPVDEITYLDNTAGFDVFHVYAVTAVTIDGLESGFSNPESVYLGPSIAHFVAGGGVASRLLLQNPHDQPVAGTFQLRDPEGRPLAVELNGGPAADLVEFQIPPRGVRSYSTDPSGPLVTGSVTVEAERRLGAVVLLSGVLGEAAVGASAPVAGAVMPVEWDTSADLQTGIALYNPGDAEAIVEVELYDNEGQPVAAIAEVGFELGPGEQISRFPFELFDLDLASWPFFSGTLAIRSTRPLALLGLRLNARGLVTVPVTPR